VRISGKEELALGMAVRAVLFDERRIGTTINQHSPGEIDAKPPLIELLE